MRWEGTAYLGSENQESVFDDDRAVYCSFLSRRVLFTGTPSVTLALSAFTATTVLSYAQYSRGIAYTDLSDSNE